MTADSIPSAKSFIPRQDIDKMKNYLDEILSSGRLTLGEYTKTFEKDFAKFTGVRHAIAVSSGTSALEIALRTQDLKPRDEVIVPTNTFAATAAAVVFAGGTPILTDVSPTTMTIDSSIVKNAVTRITRGVIAVHIGGLVCPDIDTIREICRERDLFLIEDAAHAHGSRINGRAAGSLGLAGCFSFYPTKVMTTGEGGMVTTDNDDLFRTARILRDQGKESFNSNRIVRLGYNWRMPEVCAALGTLQLRRLNEFIGRRNMIAKVYEAGFEEMGLERVLTPANQLNNYYKYTLFLPGKVDRQKFKELCREKGVLYGGEVYWPPLHMQPAFRKFLHRGMKFRTCEEWGIRIVNPPMFNELTEDQARHVVSVTRQALSRLKS